MATKLRKNNNTFVDADDLGTGGSPDYLIETTTQDDSPYTQQLIDVTKPLRLSNSVVDVTNEDNNWKYAELFDVRFKRENDSLYPSTVINVDVINGIGVSNSNGAAIFSSSWKGNTLTAQSFTTLTANGYINPVGGSGRIHDCSAIQGQLQFVNGGYAYSNAEVLKLMLDVRTATNGKIYGANVSLNLPNTGGCSELHGVCVHDYGTATGAVSSGKRYAYSIQDVSYNERFFITIDGTQLKMTQSTPSSSSDTGITGSIKIDENYIYVCTTANTWKRVSLSSF